MNFLAHAYLSYGEDSILTGNLMADFIRGKPSLLLPQKITEGIFLHRQIDDFTDHHPVNLEVKQVFKATAGRFSGVFLDIAYDHFLSNHPVYFPQEHTILNFSKEIYAKVDNHLSHAPVEFRDLFFRMKTDNWLIRYRHAQNISGSFRSISMRTRYITDTRPIYEAFIQNKKELESAFYTFFPDLETHVKNLLFSKG